MSFLWEPFQFGFMQTALVAALLIGVLCASLGVYVVLRRMAFIGDALAHAALPGVVASFLLGWGLFPGALAAASLTSLGISWFTRNDRIREDTAIGILFTGMFALGILMISSLRSFRDFTHILFGNILAVGPGDLVLIAVVALVVLLVLVLFHKELELSSVDPVHAKTIGISVQFLRTLLLLVLALTVTAGIQLVGVVLTSALLVTPAAAASLLTRRLLPMMGLSSLIAMVSGILGLYTSYYFNLASGASIVLYCTLFFGLAWVYHYFKHRVQKPLEAEV